jgi:hypothetical protein
LQQIREHRLMQWRKGSHHKPASRTHPHQRGRPTRTSVIGTNLNLGSADSPDWWRIVGVVADVRAFGQDQPAHADIYRPFAQDPFPLIAFTVRTQTDPDALTHAAEQELWRVDANLPVLKAISLRALADQALSVRRASSALISAFAALALLLACIAFTASWRMRLRSERRKSACAWRWERGGPTFSA